MTFRPPFNPTAIRRRDSTSAPVAPSSGPAAAEPDPNNGIVGLLGQIMPFLQGAGLASAFGANPLVGLLAGPLIKNERQRASAEMRLLQNRLIRDDRSLGAQQQLAGILGEQVTLPGVPGQVPRIATPEGRQQAMGLLGDVSPDVVSRVLAQGLFASPDEQPSFTTDVGKLFNDLSLAESQGNKAAAAAFRSQIANQVGGEQRFNDIRSFRNDVIRNSQPFLAVQSGLNRVRIGANADSPAGDIALVFGFMKTVDPFSVVREGEFATAENAAGIPARIRNQYNKLLTGERLSPEQRQDFLSQARAQYEPFRERQLKLIEDSRNFAIRQGLQPQDVIPGFIAPVEFGPLQFPEQEEPANVIDFHDLPRR